MVASAGLDTVGKREIPGPYRESNSDHPDRNLVAIATELSRLLGVPQLANFLFDEMN
jgi:hypothetical protein